MMINGYEIGSSTSKNASLFLEYFLEFSSNSNNIRIIYISSYSIDPFLE